MFKNLPSGERYLYGLFSLIENGSLTVTNPNGQVFEFGNSAAPNPIKLNIRNPKTYDRVLSFGSLGFGEAYMEGWWDEENNDVVGLLELFHREKVYEKAREKPSLALIVKVLAQRLSTVPTNLKNSRKNVQHHYDLGNDFYQYFLDSTWTYSCGYQQHPSDSLETMQLQKYELICQKLGLKPGESLVDVGCGWGGMLIYAAEHYGITGTGITLSIEQAKLAQQRIAEKGLGDRIKIEITDYRELTGKFDKFVSVGMFEHVGKGSFTTFMEKARDFLKPDGIGLLHTIATESDERNGPWVEKYIFPGGYLPKLYELTTELSQANLMVAHCENLKPHYAETLHRWTDNFLKNKDEISALSDVYDERFMRMWYLYLQSCEASFNTGSLQVYQLLFINGREWNLGRPTSFGTPLKAHRAASTNGTSPEKQPEPIGS
ncbi:MAG: class I SAM-dependent methyltransferase [Cyanophyceae cyanobacterium]